MSLTVNGRDDHMAELISYMLNYTKLSENPNFPLNTDPLQENLTLSLSTKYYNASVDINAVSLNNSPIGEDYLITEGYILLSAPELSENFDDIKYSLSRKYIEADVGLRLLVLIQDNPSETISDTLFETWALENGFEYILISRSSLLDSHKDREKSGLPRLMEALESNMWSNMIMKNKTASTKDSNATITPNTDGSNSINTLEMRCLHNNSDAQQTEHYFNGNSEINHDNGEDSGIENSILRNTQGGDEKEDSIESLDMFSSFISQAQFFRTQVASGNISDEDRRNQAAAMAIQLAKMMDLDNDNDVNSSDED